MRTLTRFGFACALLAGAALLAFPGTASAADFSGNWSIAGHMTTDVGVAQVSPVCKFVQAGGAITGECKGPNGEGPAAGKVFGDKIIWHWNHTATTAYGATGVSSFTGILGSDGVIRGTWGSTMAPGYTGDWTGTPVK
jgi:hypothetical protein